MNWAKALTHAAEIRGMEQERSVRKVTLSSGRTVEVVYYGDEAPAGLAEPGLVERPLLPDSPLRPLHECEHCDSGLVYPTHWDEASEEHWKVHLRCPNCEWRASGIFDQEIVEHFDEQLDQGTEVMVRDLKRLMQANMSEEIARFMKALEADAILPEDF